MSTRFLPWAVLVSASTTGTWMPSALPVGGPVGRLILALTEGTGHGHVDDGSTVTDFLPVERARGITIQSAAVTFHWPPQPSDTPAPPKSFESSGLDTHTINLIDTPGHADFTFEVLRSLRVLDGAICVVDGVSGVEAQTEKVWHQANLYSIPRIIYVNKLDREGAAFGRTVKEIASQLKGRPAVCQVPWLTHAGGSFVGIGDAVDLRAIKWHSSGDGKAVDVYDFERLQYIDQKLAREVAKARTALVELLSEHDDEMVDRFLAFDEDHLAIPASDVLKSLRRCVLRGTAEVIPVFAGASFRNIGVQPLLDAVVNLLPNPSQAPDPIIRVGSEQGQLSKLLDGSMVVQLPNDSKGRKLIKSISRQPETPLAKQGIEGCALAFKVVNDPRRGVLVYIRVYTGVIKRNATLFNTALQTSERAPRLLTMYASDAIETPSITAGQIGVISGLVHARTGDTLISHSSGPSRSLPPHPFAALHLRPITVPPPLFFASLEPHSLSAGKHLQETLAVLLREDPSLAVSVDEDTGQILLSGMGELHLEIARDRLVQDFRAKISMSPIEISYRETLLRPSGAVYRLFDKEVAGTRAKASCTASVSPNLNPSDNSVTIAPCEPPLPPESKAALHTGALAALSRSPSHHFPLHSVSVRLRLSPATDLFDAKISTPAALSAAARLATTAALSLAAEGKGTVLMEPVMRVAITVDDDSLGAVVQDLSSARGGQVLALEDSASEGAGVDTSPLDLSKVYAPPDPFVSSSPLDTANSRFSRLHTITARVPLKEMVGYLGRLRSLTGGRGSFVMSVEGFERMSGDREKAALAERGMRV
ncbi:MAG: Ribosome-releasing factor 2, mitochondrial [Piccolia ochrophora]|nr:MAG: Ribosome-releasing factor 2, mitochondrial [Piccolia ochrophora]